MNPLIFNVIPTAASGKYILFSKIDFPWRLFQGATKLCGGDMEILVACGTVYQVQKRKRRDIGYFWKYEPVKIAFFRKNTIFLNFFCCISRFLISSLTPKMI